MNETSFKCDVFNFILNNLYRIFQSLLEISVISKNGSNSGRYRRVVMKNDAWVLLLPKEWRKQWLQDPVLTQNEPVHVEEN